MVTNSKRLFYRTIIIAGLCFLCGAVLYDLEEIGVLPGSLIIAVMLDLLGCMLVFKAFVYICYPDEYDLYEQVFPCNRYTVLFYSMAAAMALATIFLLLMILGHYLTVQQEQGTLLWGGVVITGFLLLGRSSQLA